MDIVAFVGSYNKTSITHKIVNEALLLASELDKRINFEILRPVDYAIQPCRGCRNCFLLGKCPQDNYDSMTEIRQKLRQANIIILASPVYINQISGITKDMLDRLSSWTHLFFLCGKKAITVATSEGSGHYDAVRYLNMILTVMGAKVFQSECFIHGMDMDTFIKKFAEDIIRTAKDIGPLSNEVIDATFKLYRKRIKELRNNNIFNYETEYWFETGMIQCNSFEEWLKKGEINCEHI